MKNCIIGFGIITKKLFLPLFFALSQIANAGYQILILEKYNSILFNYSSAISQILIIIIPFAINFLNKKEKKNNNNNNTNHWTTKKTFFHFFLLCFIFLILNSLSLYSLERFSSIDYDISNFIYSNDAYPIIAITITSRIILKNKYYKHNIISLIFFVLISISIDLFFINIYDIKIRFELIQFLLCVIITPTIQSILFVYEKYMIEKLFYSQWTICFVLGIINLLFNGSIHIYILKKIVNEESPDFIKQYYYFFETNKVADLIFPYIISIIIQFILNVFLYLTLYNFQINYLYICNVLSNIAFFTENYKDKDNKKYFFIIFFIFQVFFFMTYLELLELKFCGLDENTRRNIQIRERKEILGEGDDVNESERVSDIVPGYSIFVDHNEKSEDEENIGMINKDNGFELQKATY